ncbi:MAG: response regulator [Alteromonadaceae bacterium]|nr:response regulator [Alteromonadaceae bacterium]
MVLAESCKEFNKLRCLVVEDEKIVNELFCEYLNLFDTLQVVGNCYAGKAALSLINKLEPDVVFLDVELPDFDGFEILRQLDDTVSPMVVFVSSHNQYAIKAFEYRAVDYLLKPVTIKRLKACVERLVELKQFKLEWIPIGKTEAGLRLTEKNSPKSLEKRTIWVKDKGESMLLNQADIIYVDAAGDYACLHTKNRIFAKRCTLKQIIGVLEPNVFKRIHRSTIVNLTCVQKVKTLPKGECILYLNHEKKVKVSRTYRKVVSNFLSAFE